MLINEGLSRDFIRLVVWYPLRWLISVLPVRMGYKVFNLMGDTHFLLSKEKKKRLAEHINSALPALSQAEINRVIRGYFRIHYANQMQVFLFPRFTVKSIAKIHSFKGLENLDHALSKGKGCVLVHPHFGPAQLPLCHLGLLGYPVMQLGLPTDDGLSYIGRNVAFRLRLKYEAAIPARIISADTFLRPVVECVKNNGVLMTTGDGAGGGKLIGKFMYVDFLGSSTRFPIGAGTLAHNTGASLLAMFTVLKDDGAYESIIHPAFESRGTGRHQIVEAYTISFAAQMESYLKKQPYLWHFWDEWSDRLAEESG